jgi:hypothetical protein
MRHILFGTYRLQNVLEIRWHPEERTLVCSVDCGESLPVKECAKGLRTRRFPTPSNHEQVAKHKLGLLPLKP